MRWFIGMSLLFLVLAGCADSDQASYDEKRDVGRNTLAINKNQPPPDLGGWSFEREIVRNTYLARNKNVSTFTYLMTFDGRIIEICPSIGYPIPYSTQLTNPEQKLGMVDLTVPQPEPNGLYPPQTAAATLVQCANEDGTVTPSYFEHDVFALPYRIKSTFQLERVGDKPSFSVNTTKGK